MSVLSVSVQEGLTISESQRLSTNSALMQRGDFMTMPNFDGGAGNI